MVLLLELLDELVEEHEFAGGLEELVVEVLVGSAVASQLLLDALEEEQVVAALAQLHVHVVQLRGLDGVRPELSQHHSVLSVDALVVRVLQVGQAHLHYRLVQGRDRVLHFLLQPTQEVRLQHAVQLLNLLERLQVPVLLQERLHVIELLRLYVIEKRPEFLGVVLHRRAREQQYSLARVVLQQLKRLRLFVLEAMCLVDHDVGEGNLLDDGIQVGHEHLERSYHYVELVQL